MTGQGFELAKLNGRRTRCLSGRGQTHGKPKDCASPRRRLVTNLTTHQFDNLLGDDKAKARTAIRAGGGIIGLHKGLEEIGMGRIGNTDPAVSHPEIQPNTVATPIDYFIALGKRHPHLNFAMAGKFDGIID
jgi:hypothetical protein